MFVIGGAEEATSLALVCTLVRIRDGMGCHDPQTQTSAMVSRGKVSSCPKRDHVAVKYYCIS